MITLHAAHTPELLDVARELCREYAAAPHVAIRWPDSERDIAGLPGEYAPPKGSILVAKDADRPIGFGCIRQLDEPGVCEMKRLYVRPTSRGEGVGELLVRALVDHARGLGYFTMRLDTAAEMTVAQALYRRLGFTKIPPYHDRLQPGDVCYQLWLA